MHAYEKIVLITEDNQNHPVIHGNANLLDQKTCSASTFKMVLCWMGLETGLVHPSSTFCVNDSYIPKTPRNLDLATAMFYSSNDYFIQLAQNWKETELRRWIDRSHFFPSPLPPVIPDQEGSESNAPIIRKIMRNPLTTPRQEHHFILKILQHQLASTPEIDQALWKCLSWPSEKTSWKLYGKTGTYSATCWFNGFGVSETHKRAVTVLLTGKDASRDLAIREFYAQFHLSVPNLNP